MYRRPELRGVAYRAFIASLALQIALPAAAQPRRAPEPPPSPRDSAPLELTGQWVSIVTEDWRFRMVTPPKNDFPGLPLTPAAQEVANNWDPARDEAEGNACKAYGAGGIMRIPGRIRISWRDDSTLVIDTDAGEQTRVLHFGDVPEQSETPTWQGESIAEWIVHGGSRDRPPVNGSLQVTTTGMKAGYLRKNGVPYSVDAVLTEYFDVLHEPDGSQWLVVKTIVEDPTYLTAPFIVSTNFRKEEDGGKWNPRPCSAD